MIEIRFEEREKIGLQYILESLHGCSPFGQERIRRLRYYTPDERQELEQELRNVERAAAHAEELKDLYDQICVVLCQMKDIRGSLRRCRELEVPDHVELFELKGYLQRLETLHPLFEKLRDTAGLTGLAFHDPAAALAILDPENTRSRGFYIPDAATPRLREIRTAKKQVEEQLYRAQTDAEKDDLRQKRVRICAEEDSEEMKVRRAMGAALAPMADDLLADADTAGRLDFLIQKALFAHRFGGVRPELTDTALLGSRMAVIGYGRIGQFLARLLLAMGVSVTVCARRAESLAFARGDGCATLPLRSDGQAAGMSALAHGYDVIFNTVPAPVLGRRLLEETDPRTLILDLASAPGGVDPEASALFAAGGEGASGPAGRAGLPWHACLRIVRAPSLPGRYAPATAGNVLADAILPLITGREVAL